MAVFAKSVFPHAAYSAFRPEYPIFLYKTILAYHQHPRKLVVDLGCGHGIVSRALSDSFEHVLGCDPSKGMLERAIHITYSGRGHCNVTYREALAESLPFLADEEVDMVVAGQAAHWFDLPRLWPEMNRIVRKGGTLAFWGYKDHVFVDYPRATEILNQYSCDKGKNLLGDYWPPERSILQNKLRDIQPPSETWEDIQRLEYEPRANGQRSGDGHLLLAKRMKLGDVEEYVRTWSSTHNWQQAHPGAKRADEGGVGDIVDEMFEKMVDVEEDWKQAKPSWKEKEVNVEWGSGILLARKREGVLSH
ncbi:MAG: hypothetical protein M1839_004146 [Geoglossum umbratile]|nr:MAG: hypothetical protein M1839_004146 [Geoglossum umbratile]